MSNLSQIKGEEAIDVMMELVEPVFAMLQKPGIQEKLKKEKTPLGMAKLLLSENKAEAVKILEVIDDTPVDGVNVIPRFITMFLNLMNNPYWRDFFGFAEIPSVNVNSTLPTASTEEKET